MVFVFCFVSFDQSFGQDSLAFLLLHAASAEVTYWCALGRWAGLESPFGSVRISGVLAGLAGEVGLLIAIATHGLSSMAVSGWLDFLLAVFYFYFLL